MNRSNIDSSAILEMVDMSDDDFNDPAEQR